MRNKYGRRSNLIPITRIYDIYPKYTYSKDVAKFMDEIVDIDRANVFTKDDMVDILDKIIAEIKALSNANPSYWHSGDMVDRDDVLEIIDKYREPQESEE